jgi:mono/diheme cytochrome c family protein
LRTLKAVAFICALSLVAASANARQDAGHKSSAKQTAPAEGAALYKRNCAVCHGDDAKGGSAPKSPLFTEPAPDLTTLAQRHDGKFPAEYVSTVLRSGVKVPGHGPAEMPVWGKIFKAAAKADQAQVNERVSALVAYLKSIQVK